MPQVEPPVHARGCVTSDLRLARWPLHVEDGTAAPQCWGMRGATEPHAPPASARSARHADVVHCGISLVDRRAEERRPLARLRRRLDLDKPRHRPRRTGRLVASCMSPLPGTSAKAPTSETNRRPARVDRGLIRARRRTHCSSGQRLERPADSGRTSGGRNGLARLASRSVSVRAAIESTGGQRSLRRGAAVAALGSLGWRAPDCGRTDDESRRRADLPLRRHSRPPSDHAAAEGHHGGMVPKDRSAATTHHASTIIRPARRTGPSSTVAVMCRLTRRTPVQLHSAPPEVHCCDEPRTKLLDSPLTAPADRPEPMSPDRPFG